MTGIVRRQAAGGLGADPGQAMRVRLRATRGIALAGCSPDIFTRSSIIGSLSRKHCIAMTVAGELCLRQRGLADSAGKSILKVFIVFAFLLAYTFLLPILKWEICTLLFLISLMCYLADVVRIKLILIISVLVTAILYTIFIKMMYIPFPTMF